VTHWGRCFRTLLLILAPLLTPFVGCLGWCSSTVTGGRFLAALKENGPGRLLARGMPSANVEELLCGLWLGTAELMHHGSTVRVRPEHQDDVDVIYFGELVTLSRQTTDVVSQIFTLFLPAALQMSGVTRSHICALKVAGEDLFEILLTIDRVFGQVIEPRS
jgi:hypothetical protein